MSSTCKSCIKSHWLEVSHDDGSNWFEIPSVLRTQKGYEDQDATKKRHSQSGSKKVDVCGSDSRTENITVDVLFCDDDPLDWYIRDGDIAWFRRYKSKGTTESFETFKAKVVFQGDDWDNDSEDGEERQFILETTVPISLPQYTGGTTQPYRDFGGAGFIGIFADSTAADAAYANSGTAQDGDYFFSTTTDTFWLYDSGWADTTETDPPT